MSLLYGSLTITIVKAKGLKNTDTFGKSDPYVKIYLDRFSIARSRTVMNNLNPVFGDTFELQVNGRYENMILKVRDHDPALVDDLLGYAALPLDDLLTVNNGKFKGDVQLGPLPDHESKGKYGSVRIKMHFTSHADLIQNYEVPHVSFPLRQGCRVMLFQDAHIGDAASLLPDVNVTPTTQAVEVLDMEDPSNEEERQQKKKRAKRARRESGTEHSSRVVHQEEADDDESALDHAPTEPWEYRRRNCWEKVYKAILHAQHFIYITGWSVDTSISLLRERPIWKNGEGPEDDDDNGMLTIGELLKRKALEGVQVCMLLWNEATSVAGMGKEGLMFTHDEFTKSFFDGSGVTINLAYRDGDTTSGNKFMWTHHQKSIILDAHNLQDASSATDDDERRRIIAFVGGLDLCDGRWDTPQHTLYRSLQNYHKDDFHQVWPGVDIEHGPREPWHDIHSRVEGPIARDVMRNFEQRWRKQAAPHSDKLVDLDDLPIISVEEEMVCDPDFWDSWSVQLFRSIDHYSAIMEDDNPVDASIQAAYVHHIRRAQRFIFIENQYFLGSAQAWDDDIGKTLPCNNVVPLELTEKIVGKIKSREPFTVYVLVPMYPEGIPADGAVQEILCWQHKTIQMMYGRIHAALAEEGLLGQETPEDYLLFFCMGQRETEEGSQAIGGDFDAAARPNQEILNATRRYAIYVHSKMMIVDDDYVICGSANINDRSLAGTRDSEIAIGAYQPHFTSEVSNGQPRGDVHAFRMGLWLSHMRQDLPCFLAPETVDCARTVKDISQKAWEAFMGEEVVELEPFGQLLKYPLAISGNGKVVSLPGNPFIPDTTAPIVGAQSRMIPDILTT